MFTIYTDGSCTNNGLANSFGGWAYILTDSEGKVVHQDKGMEAPTTNNRMELMAVIKALEYWQRFTDCLEVKVVADSKYVLDAFRQNWIAGWYQRGWRNAKNKPIPNMDLWTKLINLVEEINPIWEHVHGHTGHEMNELCDRLASEGAKGL